MNPDGSTDFYTDAYYSGIDDTTNDSTAQYNPTPTNVSAPPASSGTFSLSDFIGNNLIGAASQAYGETLQSKQTTNVNDARIASAQATAQIQGQLLAAQQASLSASQAQTKQYFIYALFAFAALIIYKRFIK